MRLEICLSPSRRRKMYWLFRSFPNFAKTSNNTLSKRLRTSIPELLPLSFLMPILGQTGQHLSVILCRYDKTRGLFRPAQGTRSHRAISTAERQIRDQKHVDSTARVITA